MEIKFVMHINKLKEFSTDTSRPVKAVSFHHQWTCKTSVSTTNKAFLLTIMTTLLPLNSFKQKIKGTDIMLSKHLGEKNVWNDLLAFQRGWQFIPSISVEGRGWRLLVGTAHCQHILVRNCLWALVKQRWISQNDWGFLEIILQKQVCRLFPQIVSLFWDMQNSLRSDVSPLRSIKKCSLLMLNFLSGVSLSPLGIAKFRLVVLISF